MKIVCGSCAAKYTVSDDKIQGKAVKVKCRKCGAVIVVSPNGEVTTQGGTPVAVVTYTVSVSDTDQRSMTVADIVAAYNDGVVDAETYVWTEGMGDWLPLKEVDALVDALHEAAQGGTEAAIAPAPVAHDLESTVAMSEGGLADYDAALAAHRAAAAGPAPAPVAQAPSPAFSSDLGSTVALDPAAAGAMFGSAPAAPAPAPMAPMASAPSFGGGGMFGGGGGGMFGNVSPAAATASAAGFAGSSSARKGDDNSAIFSLGTLTAKAAGAPTKASSNNEDSGLIDLKALAAGFGGGADVPSASPAASPFGDGGLFPLAAPQPMAAPAPVHAVAAPVVVEVAKPANKGVLFALGGAVVLLLGAVIFLAMSKSEPAAPVATAAATAEPAKTAEAASAAAAPASAEVASAPAASATAAAQAASPAGDQPAPQAAAARPAAAPQAGAAAAPKPAAAAPAPAAAPPKVSTGGCAPDDLMCLMRAGAKKKK
jgi:predicted Zn finger-like uncharacterized protein